MFWATKNEKGVKMYMQAQWKEPREETFQLPLLPLLNKEPFGSFPSEQEERQILPNIQQFSSSRSPNQAGNSGYNQFRSNLCQNTTLGHL